MKKFMKILLPIVGVGISVVGLTPALVSCTKNKSKDEISIGDVQHNNASALQNAYAKVYSNELFNAIIKRQDFESIKNIVEKNASFLTATSKNISANQIYNGESVGQITRGSGKVINYQEKNGQLIFTFDQPILKLEESFRVGAIVNISAFAEKQPTIWTKEYCEEHYEKVMNELKEVQKYISINEKILTITTFDFAKQNNAMALLNADSAYSFIWDFVKNGDKTPEKLSNVIDDYLKAFTASSNAATPIEIYNTYNENKDSSWTKITFNKKATFTKEINDNKLIIKFSTPILGLEESFRVGTIVNVVTQNAKKIWNDEQCIIQSNAAMNQLKEIQKFISTTKDTISIVCNKSK